MTVQFFKWSSEDQIAQLTQFLVNNTPASSNQLTYLTGAHTFTTAPHIELAIYSSHPDPFNTTDIVVWILDWKHRIRLFTNSEFHLEQAELTDKAIEYAHGEQRKENNPECVYFKNEQDEQLYRKSLDVVEKVVTSFIEQTYKNDKQMVVCDTNVLWLSALYKHYKVGMDMPHRKFLKQASKPIDTMPLPDHLERTSEITEDDLLLIQKSNKITFDFEYLKDCSRIGAGVRRKDTNQLVAWTLSHRDLASAALHVLPDFRRQGLAEVVLADLCKLQIEHFQKVLPGVSCDKLYFSGFIHNENTPSLNFFKKAGFEPVGLGATWMELLRE